LRTVLGLKRPARSKKETRAGSVPARVEENRRLRRLCCEEDD
jgi:hypothetical protein